jgi:hypothetical protein
MRSHSFLSLLSGQTTYYFYLLSNSLNTNLPCLPILLYLCMLYSIYCTLPHGNADDTRSPQRSVSSPSRVITFSKHLRNSASQLPIVRAQYIRRHDIAMSPSPYRIIEPQATHPQTT